MFLQDMLIVLALSLGFFFVGIPLYKIVKNILPKKRDPLKEARERLEIAHKEAEAAKLNKEAEKLYDQMYSETLDDQESTNSINKTHRSVK